MSVSAAVGATVKGIYPFTGGSEDELSFSKGDIITLTSVVDGGWWEGKINNNTGWFPSNYVKLLQDAPPPQPASTAMNGVALTTEIGVGPSPTEVTPSYYPWVVQNVLETEGTHIQELQEFSNQFLKPLKTSNILNETECATLCGNYEDVLTTQQNFLHTLEAASRFPYQQQNMGSCFMKMHPQFDTVHKAYCSNHPKAIAVLSLHSDKLDEFMVKHGSEKGLADLTLNLSKPFRRLDAYPDLLKEMERHLEETHSDRYDVNKALPIYRDLTVRCGEVRKQKEFELDVLSGPIRDWQGEELGELGELALMSQITIHYPDQTQRKDRYLLVFPGVLVTLAISPRMSGFIFKGRMELDSITVRRLDNTSLHHALEISGYDLQPLIITLSSQGSREDLLETIRSNTRMNKTKTKPAAPSTLSSSHSSEVENTSSTPKLVKVTPVVSKPWTITSLRPVPPTKPQTTFSNSKPEEPEETGIRSGRKIRRQSTKNKYDRQKAQTEEKEQTVNTDKVIQDDAAVLQVIEAYCTSSKSRLTLHSATVAEDPRLLLAEEEKIIDEVQVGNQVVIQERSLVDTVYLLKDQIKDMAQEITTLKQIMSNEMSWRQEMQKQFKLVTSSKRLAEETHM